MGELEKHVGPALRHLRLHAGPKPRKQLDVAAAAGVTRGMLSSYERGKQAPSLKNLDRVLEGLGADLGQLAWAIRMVEAQPGGDRSEAGEPGAPRDPLLPTGPPPPSELREPGDEPQPVPGTVYHAVPVPEPLRPEEERALGQMIAGFLAYVRYNREEEREEGP